MRKSILLLSTIFLGALNVYQASDYDKILHSYKQALGSQIRASKSVVTNKSQVVVKLKKSLPTGVYEPHMRNLIDKVLVYLGVEHKEDWERLLYLTAIAETDGGRYTRQIGCSYGGKGILQTEVPTERDSLRWCKVKHPELYAKIKSLRIPAKLDVHETEYNHAYAIALAYLEYYWRHVNPKNKTTLELAKLWKLKYNTIKGKGRVDKVMNKIVAMGINL